MQFIYHHRVETVTIKSLITQSIEYFQRTGYAIESNVTLEGFSGLIYFFDLVITKGQEKHPVLIKDWKRTVGVNMIINADKASENTHLSQPIIISNKFSDHAKAYANKRRITLLTPKAFHILR
jgi:hypothetical protein